MALLLLLGCAVTAYAGGPRFVAGSGYFDPAIVGQPILWAGGSISYFVDQGPLSNSVSNASATATVAAAAGIWNAVPTAALSLSQGGSLAEDVSGENVSATTAGITMPADIQSTATSTPVAIVFDADGSVIDAFYGIDASDPDDCSDSGVISRVDNLSASGAILHAVILVNGRCTGSAAQLLQIQFQLIRAFGRILGLDWSQANDGILFAPGDPSLQQLEGWPLMRPIDLDCNQLSTECLPNPLQLRTDDVAAISRLYPVTSANQRLYPAKTLTAAATISIHGTISFRRGQGMQGVNVIARPIVPGVGLPDDRYPVASVSGFLFTGSSGNPITASTISPQYGATDPTLEGFFDLSGITLPPGETQADYQLTLEAVNPLYTGSDSVGPYTLGSPTPSGAMPRAILYGAIAGMSIERNFVIEDSADDLQPGPGGPLTPPAALPASGEWEARIATVAQSSWFALPVRGGRHFTIEAQALAMDGSTAVATENKLRTVLGVWNASTPTSSPPAAAAIAPFNGAAPGITSLGVDVIANGELLLGIADQRGDGRPDYDLHGRFLYADTVLPSVLPLAGGSITINGSGFRPGMVVSLESGSIPAQIGAVITDLSPTSIVAIVPPDATATGSLDLVVTDPATNGVAAIAAGISYGDATADTLSIITTPPATLGMEVPAAFTVRVFGPDQVTPVGGVPVAFSVLAGAVGFAGCTQATCSVTTTGDGYATAVITATSPGQINLQASLTNGNALLAQFTAVATPAIASLTPALFLAPGAIWTWTPQVQLWVGSLPSVESVVNWSGSGAVANIPAATLTNSQGIAGNTITLGPWAAGTTFTLNACTWPAVACLALSAYTVHSESELLSAVSGTFQEFVAGQSPNPVVVRLSAPAGQPIAGGTIAFSCSIRLWTPPCLAARPCPPGRLLSSFNQSAFSTADGSASFTPSLPFNLPVTLTGIAIAGSTSTLPIQVEVHP